MNVLISGCSFSGCNWGLLNPNNQVTNVSVSAAGNFYINRSVIKNLYHNWDLIVVFFSGIYRIDCRVPKLYADAWLSNYDFKTNLDHNTYIHSGGILGSWTYMNSPLSKYFESQYKPMNFDYLEEQGVEPVIECLTKLEQSKKRYLWGWIYDTTQDYSMTSFGHSLGKIHRKWHEFEQFSHTKIESTPLEYCKENNLLDQDDFHPTIDGYNQFARSHVLTKI